MLVLWCVNVYCRAIFIWDKQTKAILRLNKLFTCMYVFPINTFFPQRNRTAFHRMDCKCEVIGMNLTSGFLFLKERKRKSQNEWEWVCSTCPELYRIFQNQAACCPSTCWIVSRGGGVFPARWSNPSVSSCICISVCNCDCICVRMQCVFLSEFVSAFVG